MRDKIKTFEELKPILENEKRKGHRIIHCHGVFDLLHPGHIRHFEEAKKLGDCLVVTITSDRFVNKGPGRPAFNQWLRLESLASLSAVDYVVLNDEPTAVGAIYSLKPNIYVKGSEYRDMSKDITGKISDEAQAVEGHGGSIYYTEDITFSSSSLINQFIEPQSQEVKNFISQIKSKHSIDELLSKVEHLKDLKVAVIGDAIIDIYQYASPLGQSGKGLHMSAVCHEKEVFLGGSLIIANHIADFVKEVQLVTSIGTSCPYHTFIEQNLMPNVRRNFLSSKNTQTLTKKRYVMQDGNQLHKLFETYSSNDNLLSDQEKQAFISKIKEASANADLVLVCDFGNGLIDESIADELCQLKNFLAVNTQTNSGNRGYNLISKYKKTDFISLNEPELRLAAHDRLNPLADVIKKLRRNISCPKISVTGGVRGIFSFEENDLTACVPALSLNAIDRVGAGDSYLALASLCLAGGWNLMSASFLGAIAAAMDVQIVGNRESIKKVPLCKYLTRMLK